MAWTSPRTWVAGEVVTAALLNTHLRDQLLELNSTASAWTSWSPTLTNLTVGNGTLTSFYKQMGKTVFWRVSLVCGSTTVVGTNATLTVPVAEVASSIQSGAAHMFDASASSLFYGSTRISVGVLSFISAGGVMAAAVPFAWAVSDQLSSGGSYEAA